MSFQEVVKAAASQMQSNRIAARENQATLCVVVIAGRGNWAMGQGKEQDDLEVVDGHIGWVHVPPNHDA